MRVLLPGNSAVLGVPLVAPGGADPSLWSWDFTQNVFTNTDGSNAATTADSIALALDTGGSILVQSDADKRPVLDADGAVFDGTDDNLTADANELLELFKAPDLQVEISLVITPDVTNANQALVSFGDSTSNANNYRYLMLLSNGDIRWIEEDPLDVNSNVSTSGVGLQANETYLLTVILDGRDVTLRLDGAVVKEGTLSAMSSFTFDQFTIGTRRQASDSLQFDGTISLLEFVLL